MQLTFVDKWGGGKQREKHLLCDASIPSWCNLMLWDNSIIRSYVSVIPPTSTDAPKSLKSFAKYICFYGHLAQSMIFVEVSEERNSAIWLKTAVLMQSER